MNRVCGGKQSVAERASAHRIPVRDLAADSSPVHVSASRTKRGRELTIPTWHPRFFGIRGGRSRLPLPLLDLDTGSVIYSAVAAVLIRRSSSPR